MHTILLSGGSGKRLWPLSNDLCAKQYIKLVNYEDAPNVACSMLQRVWRQLSVVGLGDKTVIAASASQVELIRNQLGSDVCIAVEPDRRDTFPAIMLACAYVKSVLGASDDDFVAIQPVDPFTNCEFFQCIPFLEKILKQTQVEIGLIGARPTYPSQKYGYILPDFQQPQQDYIRVCGFVEKPTVAKARELLAQKALWNCGVFCFRLSLAKECLEKHGLPFDYSSVFENYDKLPKTSFDYEVLERSTSLLAVPYNGMWKDLGTWNTLADEMSEPLIGNVICDNTCSNTHAVNMLDIPLVLMGSRNTVVVASHDGILVADKYESSNLKDCLKNLNQPPRYEERRWGTIKTLDVSNEDEMETITRKLKIFTGENFSYHCHMFHDEAVTVLSGAGEIIVDGILQPLKPGDCFSIPRGTMHSIRAVLELKLLEISIGKLDSDDIERKSFFWETIERV